MVNPIAETDIYQRLGGARSGAELIRRASVVELPRADELRRDAEARLLALALHVDQHFHHVRGETAHELIALRIATYERLEGLARGIVAAGRTVIVDATQADAMVKTGELVEIRDKAGAVIGFFAPLKMEHAKEYAEAAARAAVRPQDGRRGYTSEEVAAYLKSLEQRQ